MRYAICGGLMTGVLPPRGTGFLRPANWVPSPEEGMGCHFLSRTGYMDAFT
jgi:hypothetical protein